jgi:hypothetical protein
MKLQFFEPFRRIPGKEIHSKLIDFNSELYQFLKQYRDNIIKYSGFSVSRQRMDYHIALINRHERNNIVSFLSRVNYLNNQDINLNDINNFGFIGKAFVLFTPEVHGFGKTHITIAYFQYKPADIYHLINLHPDHSKTITSNYKPHIDSRSGYVNVETKNEKTETVETPTEELRLIMGDDNFEIVELE